MPMSPRLLRPRASGIAVPVLPEAEARDGSNNVIAATDYTDANGNWRAHIFNTSGTLTFTRGGAVEYLIAAGGGGGGSHYAAGGGAGGLLSGSASVTAQAYSVTVGGGGTGAAWNGTFGVAGGDGSNSSALGVSATGGGGGGARGLTTNRHAGRSGGSGGGGGNVDALSTVAGTGTAGQGNNGGTGFDSVGNSAGGGGGGAGGAGGNAASSTGGARGAGSASSISGTAVTYAQGGGGASSGTSGVGGGAASGQAGSANTGGGGGGGRNSIAGGAGGSGVVIVRYRSAPHQPTLPWDSDALAYLTAVETADSGPLEHAVRDAINTFITGCKADGIWSSIKASCILMGARTLSGALVPLAGTAPTPTGFVSADYARKTGLKGNGSTKWLDSNFAGAASQQNNFHAAILPTTDASQSANVVVSANWSAANPAAIGGGALPNWMMGITASGWTQTTLALNATNSTLVGCSRSVPASFTARANSSSQTVTAASIAPPNTSTVNLYRASTNAFYSGVRLGFYSLGDSVDLALLDARVSALYTSITSAIP